MNTSDPIIARYQSTRAIPSWGKGAVITVDAKAYTLSGNKHPYFSITADITTPASRRKNDIEAGGCLHDEILRLWPQLAPIVALHLSDANTGEPMHAEANGFYHLAGAVDENFGEKYHLGNSKQNFPCTPPADKPWQNTEHRLPTQDECLRSFAEYFRIPYADARDIRARVRTAFHAGANTVASSEDVSDRAKEERNKAGNAAAKKEFSEYVNALRPHWQFEAQAGIALLNELSAKQAERAEKTNAAA